MTASSDGARAGRVIGAALFIATLLNGLGPFAKRVGLVKRDAFQQYWAHRCGPAGVQPAWLGVGRRCVQEEPDRLVRYRRDSPYSSYVLSVGAWEWPLKLSKDVLVLLLVAIGVVRSRRQSRPGGAKTSLALWAFLCLGAIATLRGLVAGAGATMLLAGARSLAFAAVALAWARADAGPVLKSAAPWCLALLACQCFLVPLEMLSPMGLATMWLPTRAAGTLVHPNTLGVFAACVLGLGLGAGPSWKVSALLWVSAFGLVFCAGSGAGWVALAAMAGFTLVARLPISWPTRGALLLCSGLMAIAVVPHISGRPDVLDSATEGRMTVLREAVAGHGLFAALFGHGLGAGTNTAITAGGPGSPSDSTVTLMVRQLGLLGACAFYLIVSRAALRASAARLFLMVVLLCSLALNVVEVFPLNALLGLALAEAFGKR